MITICLIVLGNSLELAADWTYCSLSRTHVMFSGDEVNARFPGYSLPANFKVRENGNTDGPLILHGPAVCRSAFPANRTLEANEA